MATSKRLGIDITATNKTAAAFAGVQRSMDAMNRSLNQFKAALGAIGLGNAFERMISGIVRVNIETGRGREAADNLTTAFRSFAIQVGQSGLITGMENFAGALKSSSREADGLATITGQALGSVLTGLGNAIPSITAEVRDLGAAFGFVSDKASPMAEILNKLNEFSLRYGPFSNNAQNGFFGAFDSTGKTSLPPGTLAKSLPKEKDFSANWKDVDTMLKGIDQFGANVEKVTKTLRTKIIPPNTIDDIYGAGKAVTKFTSDFAESVAPAKSAMEELRSSMTDFMGAGKTALMDFGAGLEDVFVRFAQGGKLSFKDLIDTMIADLARLSYKMAMSGLFDAFTGKNTGGNQIANIVGAALKGIFGGGFATGGVFANSVVSRPTAFAYGGANLGIMGEAGPEAIMPLKRGPDGKLGVSGGRGAAPVVVKHVINNYGAKVEQQERTGPNGERELVTFINRQIASQVANPYSPVSSTLDARGARTPSKRR